MDPAFRSLMWYLLVGTRGGPNRRRILEELRRSPANANQIASMVGLDYRTVRHHLRLLESNRVIVRTVPGAYAPPYELSAYLADQFELVEEMVRAASTARPRRSPTRTPGLLDRASQEAP